MTNENGSSSHVVDVWGEFACFTSPMKVERWSYPFITPSAARGIFDSIFVNRHEFRWQVERIQVLSEPKYIALMRNEVKEKGPSDRDVQSWIRDPSLIRPILADGDKLITGDDKHGRTQRQTMALRDVRYRLTARILPWNGAPKNIAAYQDQFRRRVERGQNFVQPCLGCREFPAWWGPARNQEKTWSGDIDAGWMLYDVFDLSKPGSSTTKSSISVFRAQLKNGSIEVPAYDSPLVRKAVNL